MNLLGNMEQLMTFSDNFTIISDLKSLGSMMDAAKRLMAPFDGSLSMQVDIGEDTIR